MKTPSMMRLIIPIIITMATSAFGRIGETANECKARYGEPLSTNVSEFGTVTRYYKAGMLVTVDFYHNKAAGVTIEKRRNLTIAKNEKLSDVEIEELLNANAGGGKWKNQPQTNSNRCWRSNASSRIAVYETAYDAITIVTDEFVKHQEDVRTTKEKKNLEGF